MTQREQIDHLLQSLLAGEISTDIAAESLQELGAAAPSYACIDYDRETRCGFPEVIYGAGKDPDQILGIMQDFRRHQRNILVTRISPEAAATACAEFADATYDASARCLLWYHQPPTAKPGRVGIVSAGTSDSSVALEASYTLQFLGYSPQVIQDVGVAGLHRLISRLDQLRHCQVLIVAAGMEGALPSVIGGLVSAPVIAVPTNVGYGAHFDGLTPLLAMINSCASGITVTNIDNGFGAACAAARILSVIPPATTSSQQNQATTENLSS